MLLWTFDYSVVQRLLTPLFQGSCFNQESSGISPMHGIHSASAFTTCKAHSGTMLPQSISYGTSSSMAFKRTGFLTPFGGSSFPFL